MKTNPQNVHLIALLIAITATFVTHPMQGQLPTAQFIENSCSSLTLIYNGTDITATAVSNTSADHWTVTLPQALPFFVPVSWAEPENPGLNPGAPTGWNQMIWNNETTSSTQLFVVSDTSLSGLGFANGSSVNVGGRINLQFTDVSDAAVTTPDSGSTLVLLFLALAGVVGVSRLRSIRLALTSRGC